MQKPWAKGVIKFFSKKLFTAEGLKNKTPSTGVSMVFD
jgi:hypothetical protein